jgi:site-specific DNA recombinase
VSKQDLEATYQLEQLEQDLNDLKDLSEELTWLIEVMRDFQGLWEVLSLVNRHRLIRCLVNRVVLDEANGQMRVYLADFCAAA